MKSPRILVALAGLTAAALAAPAAAQVASTQPAAAGTSGWTFDVAPYFWLITLRSNLTYDTPRGNTLTSQVTAGINDYISDLNFAGMVGGEARNGPFSLMTDGLFTSLSLTTSTTHFGQLNLGSGPVFIPRSQQLDTGTRTNLGVWSLDGAYTVVAGAWGNLDVLAGVRMLGVGASTNYTLTSDIDLPDRTVALSRNGSLGLGADYWQGVGGVRGRINIPNSEVYLPFWLDVGDGGLFTWQAYVAVAYQFSFGDLSLGYRYLDFSQGGSGKTVQNLSFGGALLAANFHF